MTDEQVSPDARAEQVALGVIVPCVVYGGSLAAQVIEPSVRALLTLDLGQEARPTYYARVAVSLLAGVLASGLARLAMKRPLLRTDRARAWVTALCAGVGVLLAIFYP